MIRPGYIFAALLALAGLLLPVDATIELLRGKPVAQLEVVLRDQLQLGVLLFKASLVLLGAATAIVVSLAGWKGAGYAAVPSTLRPHDALPLSVIVIAAIATAMRFYRLDAGLWIDEIMTYENYANQPFGVLVSSIDSLNHHILYSLFAHASFLIFGEGAWSLRLPAVLFGIGSILALYVFARVFVTRREAVLSAALLAFSYHHVWFSQNARGYTALLFFSLLSSWMLVRALREQRLQLWLWYAVFAALGVYVHLTMLFMVMGHVLIFLWHRLGTGAVQWRVVMIEFFSGFGIAGLITLTLYALVLPQLLGGIYLEGVETTIETWTNPLWTLLELVRGLQIGFAGSIAAAVAGVVFLSGLVRIFRTEPLVAFLFIAPIVVTIIVIVGLGHPMFPRTFFFAIGFGIMIVISGTLALGDTLVRVAGMRFSNPSTVGTALCIGMIGLSALSIPAAYGPKQDYSAALEYVEQQSIAGDAIATAGVAAIPYREFYKVEWDFLKNPEELKELRSAHKRVWLLYTMSMHMHSAHPEIMAIVERDFTLVKQFPGTLGGGTIFVAVSDLPSP